MNRVSQISKHVLAADQPKGQDPLEFINIASVVSTRENKLRTDVRRVLKEYCPPLVPLTETATLNLECIEVLKRLQIGGFTIDGHGCAGLSNTAGMLVVMELGRINASLATIFLVHFELAAKSIAVCGTEEQKRYWLPKMATLEKLGAFGLTEPDLGSAITAMKTTATKTAGGWLLNGSKRWIGLGGIADVVVVWAKVDGNVHGFLIEKGSKGFSAKKMENKMALRIVQNSDIELRDCFVPDSHVLRTTSFKSGPEKVLEISRAFVAGLATGVLIGAYEKAIEYCLDRQQFGKPIASFQLIQERLMRVLGLVQAMVLTSLHVGRLIDQGSATIAQTSLAKATVTRLGREGVALCREVVGGNGIIADYGVIVPFMDMEALYTYEGTYDINMLVAGRIVTNQNAIS